ncbi:MAG: cellulase family glycosylhydrolase [Proteobacteria bacterium]|nr:cellulase family glycosylhydrolase [Pseudomonadota bacterium]
MSITLTVAEDAYLGNAQFVVDIDGMLAGGIQTATTLHNSGQWQTISLNDLLAPGAHTVKVTFLKDAYGGSASMDRNLYVGSVSMGGLTDTLGTELKSTGNSVTANFSIPAASTVPSTPVLTAGTPPPVPTTAAPAPATINSVAPPAAIPSTTDTGAGLTLTVAEDAYLGNAQFTVAVDGKQVGGIQTATTLHNSGQWQTISLNNLLAPGAHTVKVTFLKDAYGGSASMDRNLYVGSVSMGGLTDTLGTELKSTGNSVTANFSIPAASSTPSAPVLTAGTPPPATTTPVVGTTPPPTKGVSLLGVNLSGAEYGDPVTGVLGHTYTYPTNGEIDYFASLGMNVVRIPIQWQRLQPVQNGPLDQTQLACLDGIVAHAATQGVKVLIDAHNYGIAFGSDIGSAGTPNASFANFWSQMATHFKNDPNVVFDIMNEPHDQTATQWAASAQAAVTAIRATGATQEILVSGSEWDGGSSWISSGNAAALVNIQDPANNLGYEVHEYFDTAATGTSTMVVSPTIGPERLADITQWAEEYGKKLFLGEVGAGSDPTSLTALSNTLNYINANSSVWQGATYWAAGPWNSNYMFSANPQNGHEAPQAAVLAAAVHH